MGTHAIILLAYHFADEQGHCRGVETEFLLQVAIDLAHLLAPLVIVGIGLALMQQDALDDTVFSGRLRHREQALVGVAAILIEDAVHPVALLLGNQRSVFVLVEEGDGTAFYGHRHDADAHTVGHDIEQRAPEPVGRPQVGIGPAEGRHGLAPLAERAVSTVSGCHAEIAVAHLQVLRFDRSLPYHVRLS